MKLLAPLLCALQLVVLGFSYSISEATVKVNNEAIHFGEITTQEIKQLNLHSPKDKLDIEVQLLEEKSSSQPHQVLIMLGDGKGLDMPFFPKYNVEKNAIKLVTAASKLPLSIRNLDIISISLIVAHPGNTANLYKSLGQLVPSAEFKDLIPYKPSSRIGYKPQIFHTFKQDPSMVNAFIPVVFSGVGFMLFMGLLGAWVAGSGSDLFGASKGMSTSQLLVNTAFLTCLLGFELIFIAYYFGMSIFSSLYYAAILAVPTVYFGSSTFRDLASSRKLGKV